MGTGELTHSGICPMLPDPLRVFKMFAITGSKKVF